MYNGSIYKIESGWTENISIPSTPHQIYPANGSYLEQSLLNFEWEKLDYRLYRLQISNDSLFNNFFVITHYLTGDTTFIGNNLYIENNPWGSFFMNRKYYWRVRSENKMGVSDWSETWSFTTSSPSDVNEAIVSKEFKLHQNYPNPFNPTTSIQYAVSSQQFISIKIYDVLGNEVATLVDEEKPIGVYEVEFDAKNLSSGVYFYQLKAGSFVETKKMVLLQ